MKRGYEELTLDLLQKSPEAGQLLVMLHDKHKLYSLAKNRQPSARSELAEIMGDLLSIGLTAPEKELVTDVLMSLMRQAELDLKAALAERLSTMGDIPLRLVVHLANDDISVADPILRLSKALEDTDLIYIVRSQGEDHWQSIAQRASMSDGLIDALAETKNVETAVKLSENQNIKLTSNAVTIFTDMAKESDELAAPLLQRDELPHNLASTLYQFVGAELKEFIKENFDTTDSNEFDEMVDDIVLEFAEPTNDEASPSQDMVKAAENMLNQGALKPNIMVDNLRRGQISNFIAMFSVYCGLPYGTVVDLLKQSNAQGLAVACKATGILKPEFVNIYLLTSRLRCGRIIDQADMVQALIYFDRIKPDVAKRILNQSRH